MGREELEAFYSLLLPERGRYCTFQMPNRDHIFAGSFTEFIDLSMSMQAKAMTYHGCASYSTNSRKKEDVLWTRCLWVDIDVRDGKTAAYATKEEAFEGLRMLEDIYGKALVVWSGGGLHAYWPFTRDLSPREWLILANKLHQDIKRLGVKVDASRTRDIASVLRLPGSTNERYAARVEIVQWPGGLLDPPMELVKAPDSRGARPQAGGRALSPPLYDISADTLSTTCPQIQHLRDGSAPSGHDSWFFCASILKCIEGGEDLFYKWSERQDGAAYVPEDAVRAIESSTAATGCAAFAETSEGHLCKGCKFADKGINPIKAALRATALEKEGVPFLLPEGWVYQNGKITPAVSKKGASLAVSHRPIWVDGLIRDPATEDHFVRFKYLDANRIDIRSFMLSSKEASAHNATSINGKGLAVASSLWPSYARDSQNLYEELCIEANRDPTMTLIKKFGWATLGPGGKSVFVFGHDSVGHDFSGKHAIDESDVRVVRYARAMKLADPWSEKLFDQWQEIIHSYLNNAHTPLPMKVAILMSFAAPLIFLAGHRGFGGIIANFTGKSGGGKTTGLMGAASVWGRYKDYCMPTDSSLAALYNDVVTRPHLPFIIDEITITPWGKDPEALHSWIKNFAEGTGPSRATQTGGSREIGHYNTIAITGSNSPIRTLVRSIPNINDAWATERRIIEVEVPRLEAPVNLEFNRLGEVYGTAGRRWIRHILQPHIMQSFHNHLETWSHPTIGRQDRFLYSLIMLLTWADKQLLDSGILLLGEDIIEPFVDTQLAFIKDGEACMQLNREQEAVLEFIDQGDILIFEKAPNGKTDAYPINSTSPSYSGNRRVDVCKALDTKSFYCRPTELRAHIKKVTGKSGSVVLNALKAEGACSIGRAAIMGMKESGGSRDCYVFTETTVDLWRDILLRKGGGSSRA